MLDRKCKKCGKDFKVFPCRTKNGWAVCCSRSCAMLLKSPRYWVGRKMTEQHKNKMSKTHKKQFKSGRKQWNEGLKGWNSGDKNPAWKGGVSPINTRIRQSLDFKLWRKAVFERDNYRCVFCFARGIKGKRVILNADHIKPFSRFPELRFELSNGRTLCINCHKKTETYGRKTK